jgi:hypothetical protein
MVTFLANPSLHICNITISITRRSLRAAGDVASRSKTAPATLSKRRLWDFNQRSLETSEWQLLAGLRLPDADKRFTTRYLD